jgi:hypothetical protein
MSTLRPYSDADCADRPLALLGEHRGDPVSRRRQGRGPGVTLGAGSRMPRRLPVAQKLNLDLYASTVACARGKRKLAPLRFTLLVLGIIQTLCLNGPGSDFLVVTVVVFVIHLPTPDVESGYILACKRLHTSM